MTDEFWFRIVVALVFMAANAAIWFTIGVWYAERRERRRPRRRPTTDELAVRRDGAHWRIPS